MEILRAVASSGLLAKEALIRLDVPFSTYYRWKANFEKQGIDGLRDRSPFKGKTWNQLLPGEEKKILEMAELFPDCSPRKLSCDISDNHGFSVSESSVYRISRRSGLGTHRDCMKISGHGGKIDQSKILSVLACLAVTTIGESLSLRAEIS